MPFVGYLQPSTLLLAVGAASIVERKERKFVLRTHEPSLYNDQTLILSLVESSAFYDIHGLIIK